MNKHAKFDLEIPITLRNTDCIATAEASGYHDPGSCYGPVDSSYPPESECEIFGVEVREDKPGGAVLTLTDAELDEVSERLERAFWERYEE